MVFHRSKIFLCTIVLVFVSFRGQAQTIPWLADLYECSSFNCLDKKVRSYQYEFKRSGELDPNIKYFSYQKFYNINLRSGQSMPVIEEVKYMIHGNSKKEIVLSTNDESIFKRTSKYFEDAGIEPAISAGKDMIIYKYAFIYKKRTSLEGSLIKFVNSATMDTYVITVKAQN